MRDDGNRGKIMKLGYQTTNETVGTMKKRSTKRSKLSVGTLSHTPNLVFVCVYARGVFMYSGFITQILGVALNYYV